jgi:hypothetical protein
MTTFINPSAEPFQYRDDGEDPSDTPKPKTVWLPNWYEACELMITYGAKEKMHAFSPRPSSGDPYIHAMGSIREVFTAEQADALSRLYETKEPPESLPLWSYIGKTILQLMLK